MKNLKNKKGFFSVYTAALSVFVLVFTAGAVFSLFDFQQASLQDLEAKIVKERFDDAKTIAEATVQDAAFDYFYSEVGCNVLSGNYCVEADFENNMLSPYLSASKIAFNGNSENGITADFVYDSTSTACNLVSGQKYGLTPKLDVLVSSNKISKKQTLDFTTDYSWTLELSKVGTDLKLTWDGQGVTKDIVVDCP